MANDAYTKALKEILSDPSPAQPTSRTRAQIEADILSVSNQLKGPLSNAERLCFVQDRRELRKQLDAVQR